MNTFDSHQCWECFQRVVWRYPCSQTAELQLASHCRSTSLCPHCGRRQHWESHGWHGLLSLFLLTCLQWIHTYCCVRLWLKNRYTVDKSLLLSGIKFPCIFPGNRRHYGQQAITVFMCTCVCEYRIKIFVLQSESTGLYQKWCCTLKLGIIVKVSTRKCLFILETEYYI